MLIRHLTLRLLWSVNLTAGSHDSPSVPCMAIYVYSASFLSRYYSSDLVSPPSQCQYFANIFAEFQCHFVHNSRKTFIEAIRASPTQANVNVTFAQSEPFQIDEGPTGDISVAQSRVRRNCGNARDAWSWCSQECQKMIWDAGHKHQCRKARKGKIL
ncbi:uncharacterized protein ARMOST_20613 [Armillaria ostoyae]|uniref:MYND-type domain-containing protein n=1 Tax=Armillaria ostoyae TaxID=47428 RepID=A0A284S7T1_ARMOS|nr:uncharacterized protein ARMOST_20613 [Armillaria ostoyae]